MVVGRVVFLVGVVNRVVAVVLGNNEDVGAGILVVVCGEKACAVMVTRRAIGSVLLMIVSLLWLLVIVFVIVGCNNALHVPISFRFRSTSFDFVREWD